MDLTAWHGDVRAHADQAAGDQVRRSDHRGLRSGRGGGAGASRTWRTRCTGPTADRTTGAVCGLGPELEVDGRTYPTAVTGTIGAVLDGTPLTVTGCGAPVRLSAGNAPGTRHRHRPVHGHPAHAAALDGRLVGGDEHGGRDPARRRRAQLDDQPAGPRRGVRPGGPPGAAGERQRRLAGHARWTRADAAARRRLDAGLPAPGRRRRPGDARVHPEPALPGRARGSVACWLSCSWRRRCWWGDARSVPLR